MSEDEQWGGSQLGARQGGEREEWEGEATTFTPFTGTAQYHADVRSSGCVGPCAHSLASNTTEGKPHHKVTRLKGNETAQQGNYSMR